MCQCGIDHTVKPSCDWAKEVENLKKDVSETQDEFHEDCHDDCHSSDGMDCNHDECHDDCYSEEAMDELKGALASVEDVLDGVEY